MFEAGRLNEVNPLMSTLKPQSNSTIQQYGDRYTGRWWVGCYILYIEEGTGPKAPPRGTKCNSPPINGQYTNFISFDVAL